MTLNRKQRLIVILATCAVVTAMLFPPWEYVSDIGHSAGPAGYCCIFWADMVGSRTRIDPARLLIEVICIAVASGMAFVFAAIKPPS